MDNKKKVLVILPAFNESVVIASVIRKLRKEGFKNILVVDDCSKDETPNIAKKEGAIVLKHLINRGAGAATATGIEYGRKHNYDYSIIMDSDGQHSTDDAKKLLTFASKYDVVIGSRLIDLQNMPFQRKIANFIGSLVTYLFFGLYLKDSQTGFKVLNKKAMSMIKIRFDRYEFCSEMAGEIHKNKLSYKEVPIKVIYTDHSIQKGQTIGNGFRMVLRFIFRI